MAGSLTVFLALSIAANPASPAFTPDPVSVEREGPAYRYPQAGWIVLHVEGEPYERGFQHGKLLAPEIEAYVRCYAAMRSPKAPADGWEMTRLLADALFMRRIEPEFLEELKGIADGAAAGGGKFQGRPLDLTDIVAINLWPEVMTLDNALEATPTGLEGRRFPGPQAPRPPAPPEALRCSAFAATGSATRDGKAVIGHITMFSLYACNFFNVWIDLKPKNGHRVLFQTSPGGIQSGLDYYMNDAGLVLCETTIAQTRFNAEGASLGSQSRKAMQYSDSIDKAVAIFLSNGNGLYTNEWLLADTKTNEIALFELGTRAHRLMRSSRNEWFGGTDGFYWGCNNTKDLDVRLETIASTSDRPASLVFVPTERDRKWVELYNEHRGRIDADFGKLAFTSTPLAYHSSCDAKFTTTDLVKDLKTWALFGPPLGRCWRPTPKEYENYPEIRTLVPNPWAVLEAGAPAACPEGLAAAVDLKKSRRGGRDGGPDRDPDDDGGGFGSDPRPEPAWRGTILPATDADLWLASAFPALERYAARERSLLKQKEIAAEKSRGDAAEKKPRPLSEEERDRLSLQLFQARSDFLSAARAPRGAVPLAQLKAEVATDGWARLARGRGTLLLNDLRNRLGAETAEKLFDEFGTQHAGRRVASAEFIAALEKGSAQSLAGSLKPWLEGTGLASLRIAECKSEKTAAPGDGAQGKERYTVSGQVAVEGEPAPSRVEVTVESEDDETSASFAVEGGKASFHFDLEKKPRRVVADKYSTAARANGGAFHCGSFFQDLPRTLIVYGTRDEEAANREAAEDLQRAIVEQRTNFTVPIRSDSSLSDDELSSRHLILIGRPDANSVTDRLRDELPVKFGWRSFTVRGKTYAHQESAVIAAGENPRNRRWSIVVVAGLSAGATYRAAPAVASRIGAPVRIIPATGKTRDLAPPPPELVRELSQEPLTARR